MKLLLIILHFLAIAVLLYLALKMFLASVRSGLSDIRKQKEVRLYLAVFAGIFLFIGLYQIYLQFFIGNPKLDYAQKRFDQRSYLEELHTDKGRILDRNGVPLATYRFVDGIRSVYYPSGKAAAHIIGYSSRIYGRAGLELIFSDYLLGKSNNSLRERSNTFENRFFRMKAQGLDLYTTIDYFLQQRCDELLKNKRGAIVVIAPRTGEILAMASAPSFNPNEISSAGYFKAVLKDKINPLINRGFQAWYPPGSTFKVVTASVAFEKGKDDSVFPSQPGGYTPKGAVRPVREYPEFKKDADWKGYGDLDIERALTVSSNVYFARMGVELGAENMSKGSKEFYFDRNIPWQSSNRLLNRFYPIKDSFFARNLAGRDRFLSIEDVAWQSIGQAGVLATPLHMALIAGSIANSGVMMAPKIELHLSDRNLNAPISRRAAARIAEMMVKVVAEGTGKNAGVEDIKVAGKTGTAEVAGKSSHAWFIGFAPAEKPEIAFAVIVENSGFGGVVAAPIAKQIILQAKQLGYF